jgi:hypothetical protein
MSNSLHTLHRLAFAGLLACGLIPPVAAADDAAQARFRAEMAVCASGQSNQTPATCREEAEHALAAARRGGLDDNQAAYPQNAAQRCEALAGSERADCQSRARGMGGVEGSVASGGILRETVTTTVTPAVVK